MSEELKDKLKELRDEAQKIYEQFDTCQRYKDAKGISTGAKRGIDFYEGRQWLDIKTKLPFERPQLNIIQNIADQKIANVTSKVWKINFLVDEDFLTTTKVSKFSEVQMKKMQQADLDYEFVKDNIVKGTGITIFHWNPDSIGSNGDTEGELEGTPLDLFDFACADPSERNVQKQEYIIWRSRESVKSVKDSCKFLSDEEKERLIIPEGFKADYNGDTESTNDKMIYVYTKMFRIDGEVYFEKSTKDILIQRPTPLNPNLNIEAIREERRKDKEESEFASDSQNKTSQAEIDKSDFTNDEKIEKKYKANLYPIRINSFVRRNNSIFGISFVEQMIPMQKIINQLIATSVMCATKSALPTIIVKEGAIAGGTIDLSKAGSVIKDRSPYGEDGIKLLNTGTIPTAHYELAQSMINLSKDVYRANDVLNDGSKVSSNLSGIAVEQLTTIQEKPVAQWQEILGRSLEDEGRILEMFYKLFYRRKTFSYQLTNAEMMQRYPNDDITQMSNSVSDYWDGADYIDTPFNVTVEAGEGVRHSELATNNMLNTLFLNGTIKNLSTSDLEMLMSLAPNSYFPKRNEFMMLLKQREQGEVAQLTQIVQEQQAQLEQMGIRQQAVEEEYTSKINQYNDALKKYELLLKDQQKTNQAN